MATTIPDEAAAFLAAEYPRLVGTLTLYTGQPGLSEELAQEALLRACRRWEHVRQLQRPGGWTHRVAMNLANSHFRRVRAARRASRRLGRDGTVHHDPDGADRVAVRTAVEALPSRQKSALILRYYLGMTVAEAAAQLGVSQDAVRSLTKRALTGLRASLGSDVEASATPSTKEATNG